MPKHHSAKRAADALRFARWDAAGDGPFTSLGLTRDQVKAVQAQMQGGLYFPGDPGYDDGRLLFNPVFDPTPPMIAVCETESDVYFALFLSGFAPMPFTVRAGGHSTAGFSGGTGVMIDVRHLDSHFIDSETLTARVGAGCDFGTLNKALAFKGLHLPTGDCDDVCVAGFMQGGGLSRSSTTFGMNCDNVLSVRVMLSDGSIVVADATRNADLFWAIRGGTGGNFGILLEVTYQLRPLGDVMGFSVAWDISTPEGIAQAVAAMMLLQSDYMAGSAYAPKLNLQALVVWQTKIDPNQPKLPKPVPVFMVRGLWVGDPSGGAAAMAPLAALPGAVTQGTITDSFLNVVEWLLGYPQDQPILPDGHGMPNEDKASRYVAQAVGADFWTDLLTYVTEESPNTLSYMYLELYGGAIADYPAGGNAFVHRGAFYNAVLDVFWYEPHDRSAAEAFLRGWIARMETIWNGEVYQNYASMSVPDYRRNYWGDALPGLVWVKGKYDAAHRFTFAQEVSMPPLVPLPPLSSLPAGLAAALAQTIDYTGGRPPPAPA